MLNFYIKMIVPHIWGGANLSPTDVPLEVSFDECRKMGIFIYFGGKDPIRNPSGVLPSIKLILR